MSQEQLAIQLGISAKQLSKNERGQNKISISRYEAALRILRPQKQTMGGFGESQATYDGPRPTKDAVRLVIHQMEDEMNSFHHRMMDKMKLCLEMMESL